MAVAKACAALGQLHAALGTLREAPGDPLELERVQCSTIQYYNVLFNTLSEQKRTLGPLTGLIGIDEKKSDALHGISAHGASHIIGHITGPANYRELPGNLLNC